MSELQVYYRAISELKNKYSGIQNFQVIASAINNLKNEAEALRLEMSVTAKLITRLQTGIPPKNHKELLEIILDELLINEGLESMAVGKLYYVKGYENDEYHFEVTFISDNYLSIERRPTDRWRSSTASSKVDQLSSLHLRNLNKETVRKILKNLKIDLKEAWDGLNFDHTTLNYSSNASSMEEIDEFVLSQPEMKSEHGISEH